MINNKWKKYLACSSTMDGEKSKIGGTMYFEDNERSADYAKEIMQIAKLGVIVDAQRVLQLAEKYNL